MGLPNSSDKNELIRICMAYRFISLAVFTFVYFLMYSWEVTPLRLSVVAGMAAASIISTYMYNKNFSRTTNAGMVATMCLEIVAYGILIMISGGFSSPYLWYFISSLTIVMATGRYEKRIERIMMPLATVWGLLCALAGEHSNFPREYLTHPAINTGIAFLVVIAGFYILFVYVGKLEKNQQELDRLNQSLRLEKIRSEQALHHTMDIYESFNLFGISDPGKVMDALTALLYRSISPGGCILLRFNLYREMETICSRGLLENHKIALLKFVSGIELSAPQTQLPVRVDVLGKNYKINYINNLSGIQGILITPFGEVDTKNKYDAAQQAFYLELAGIIMHELDLHAMVESYIICDEQNRIAAEIHDTVIQKLFAIACNLHLLKESQTNLTAKEVRIQLDHIAEAVESTMRGLREAIYGLRWDSGGKDLFAEKLNLYLDELRNLSGIHINLVLDENTKQMTANEKTAVYRIICEAVNNALRHGDATQIEVLVDLEQEYPLVEISDNGKGFDQHRLPSEGQGLKNMYQMASLLKGKLVIETEVGKGTVIRCSLPH